VARREAAIAGHSGAADRRALRLNSPLVVQWEYASEERQEKRDAAYRALVDGAHAEDVAFAAVVEVRPRRVLDAGCGTGAFAERVQRETDALVEAIDLSPRMAALTSARGVSVYLGDVHSLPFPDGAYDVVVANWLLHHLERLDEGLAQLARVLRPGGRLVAGAQGREHLLNVWELLGDAWQPALTFDDVSGADALARHFESVEARAVGGAMVFPDAAALRDFVTVTCAHAHLADRVPDVLDGPIRGEVRHTVFVAEKAA
jgi:SAM-dependent methyltransferase